MSNVTIAFAFTLFAGLATGVGSTIAFLAKTTNTKFLSVALGLSGGVMIYVSFMEILDKAQNSLVSYMGNNAGEWLTIASFFGGIIIAAIIDWLVPSYENPHELHKVEELSNQPDPKRLLRMGTFSALAIAIHNFPEGLATFTATLKDPQIGLAIAFAIAIHNIPEGIAVSFPIYYSTGNKSKAFWLSFLSGLAEPAGAVLGYVVLRRFLNDMVFGILFAAVAGIMVFISVDELLPAAREYGKPHWALFGVIMGMMIMAVSLMLFR